MPSTDMVYRFLGLDAGAGAQFDRMGAKTAALGKTSNAALASVKRLALGFGALGVVVGVESVKQAANYQTALTQLTTGAGETAKGLKYVHDALLRMAGPMGESATSMAKGLYLIESAGYHGAAGVKVLRAAIEGAKADGADIATVGDAVTTALNSYKLGAKQATATTNAMVAAVAIGKTHMEDLAASLGNVLPEAAALNVPLSQVLGAMATMTFQGTNAAKASQYLRFALAALANPSSKAQKELASLGLSSKALADATAQRGLTGAFLMLEDAVGNKFPKGSAAYIAAMSDIIGGTRGMQAALELTGGHLPTFQRDTQRVADAAKHAGKNVDGWGKYTKTMEHNLHSAGSAINSLEIQLGEHLLPTATKALNWIATDGVKDLTKFGHFVGRNKTLLEDLGIAFGGIAVSIKALNIARSVAGTLGWARTALRGSSGGVLSKATPVPVYVTNWGGKTPGAGGSVAKTAERDAVEGGAAAGVLKGLRDFGKKALGRTGAASGLWISGDLVKSLVPGKTGDVLGSTLKGAGLGFEIGGPPGAATVGALTAAGKGIESALGWASASDLAAQQKAMTGVVKQLTANGQGLQSLMKLHQIADNQIRMGGSISKTVSEEIAALTRALGIEKNATLVAGEMIGTDLGQGLVKGIEAQIPHSTMAGKLLVASTVKQMRLAAEAHSPSRATYRLGGDLGQGLINGWTDKQVAKTLAHDLQSGLTQLANSVANARTRLGDALAAEHQFVQQGMTFAALSNVPTVDSGYTGQTTRLTSIGSFLHGQAKDYARFAKDLRRLSHIGLSKQLISQIAQMGPTQGLQYAQQILAGGAGYAHHLDAYNKQIARSVNAIGREQYGAQITADRHGLRELVTEQRRTNHLLEQMARQDHHGGVSITVNGRNEKLTDHDAREIITAIRRYERRTGKG